MKATRFGDYERVVKFPVFADYKIHVVVTDDLQKSWNARCEEEYDAADVEAMYTHVDGGSIIFFRKGASAGTIAHESWHAIRGMLLDAGAELDDEIVAYHLTYLVDDAFYFVWHQDFI